MHMTFHAPTLDTGSSRDLFRGPIGEYLGSRLVKRHWELPPGQRRNQFYPLRYSQFTAVPYHQHFLFPMSNIPDQGSCFRECARHLVLGHNRFDVTCEESMDA
jgi:hypothetical protein